MANNSIEKGTVDLLCAAERLWQRRATFEVVLAGPEMPNFRQFVSNYAFVDRVRRLGVLSEAEKRDFFAGIDVFALPSRSDSFGWSCWRHGRTICRMWSTAPVVPPTWVRHECDGLQVRCGNVDELAEQLKCLIDDPMLRRRLEMLDMSGSAANSAGYEKLDTVYEVSRDAKALRSESAGRHSPLRFADSASRLNTPFTSSPP